MLHLDDQDPFAAFEEDDNPGENASEVTELQQLVSTLGNSENSCSASEFLAQIGPTSSKQHCQGDIRVSTSGDEEEEEEEESTVVEPRLKSLSESLTSLKDVFEFLDYKGFTEEATQVMSLVSTVASLCHSEAHKRSTQTTLDHFIHSSVI